MSINKVLNVQVYHLSVQRNRTKGFKLYDRSTKVFIRSRDVVFDEEKFHEFDKEQSSNPNSEQLPFDPFIVQNADDNANRNDVDDQQDAAENNVPEPAQHDQQVGETFEETFMNEVRNVGERKIRRPPNRFDDECHVANDLTADINEPTNIDEAYSGEYSTEWKKATDQNSIH